MIALDDLLDLVWSTATPIHSVETLRLNEAVGRVLVEPVLAPMDVPQFDNSAMDGYAVRCLDFTETQIFPISQRIPAGVVPQALEPGSVAKILTGAALPAGADAVVMQEDAQILADGRVQFANTPNLGQWTRPRGQDLSKGQEMLSRGALLDAFKIGLLASVGIDTVQVRSRIQVGLLITGSELQNPGQALQAGQIYNSNEFVWKALLNQPGVEVHSSGLIPDTPKATVDAIKKLSHCDVLISSAGVSNGEEDHVKPALEMLGKLHASKVAMKPGKPVAWGHLPRSNGSVCCFFGLPGNPVSSAVAFLLIVQPFLKLLQGMALHTVDWRQRMRTVEADFDWPKPDLFREEFLRVSLNDNFATLFPNQNSGVLSSMVHSNALVRLPVGHAVKRTDSLKAISFQDLLT